MRFCHLRSPFQLGEQCKLDSGQGIPLMAHGFSKENQSSPDTAYRFGEQAAQRFDKAGFTKIRVARQTLGAADKIVHAEWTTQNTAEIRDGIRET